jgi:hypothetical protein
MFAHKQTVYLGLAGGSLKHPFIEAGHETLFSHAGLKTLLGFALFSTPVTNGSFCGMIVL